MQVACTYAVPLHNGNHSATFILDRNIWNDEKNEQAIKPIFKNYDTLDELLKLNYEKHVEDLVRNILEKYLLKDICKSNERLEVSKNFIKIMDKHSMIIFKRIITFCWTLTSDGLNYRSGGIGCCKCDTQKDKRKLIGSSLKNKIKLSYKSPKKFWGKILTSDELCKEISEKDFICKAGTKMDNHYRNNENIPFQERNNIKKFEGFN
ncbi:hypothetical protein [Apibacter sp. HY039]|uniref:hypothetical protein n=1 Tax=Apibacter sp. HY039 TaxID=2501476 RepID=UPI00351A8C98